MADIKAAAQWLSTEYKAPQLLIGHSLGGAAALAAANDIESLKAVGTIGAPFDPAHSVLHYADKISEVDKHGSVEVTLGGRKLTISRGFLEDLADTNPETYLRTMRKPLMLVHSPVDQTVGIDNAQIIFRVTKYPKSLVALDKADHLVTKQGTAQRAADLIAAWAEQYIEPDHTPAEVGPEAAVSHLATGTRFGVVVRNNDLSISTDRTKSEGGRGNGHTAEGLLMSALASGTAQAVKAAAKGMMLDDVNVTVTHIHESTFERRIELVGNLSTQEKSALLNAGKKADIVSLISSAHIVDVF